MIKDGNGLPDTTPDAENLALQPGIQPLDQAAATSAGSGNAVQLPTGNDHLDPSQSPAKLSDTVNPQGGTILAIDAPSHHVNPTPGDTGSGSDLVVSIDPSGSMPSSANAGSTRRRRLFSALKSVATNSSFLTLAVLLLSALAAVWEPPLALVGLAACTGGGIYRFRHWRRAILFGGIAGAATYVALLVVLTLVLPALHAFTNGAWQFLPMVAALMVGGLALAVSRSSSRRLIRFAGLAGVGLGVLLVPFFAFTNTVPWVIEWQMRNAIEPVELTELPETVNDRLVPRRTAQEFIQNANRDNRLTVPQPHLLLTEDNLYWQSSLDYTVWYGKILGSTNGVIRIDADRTEMDADVKSGADAAFLFGDQSWVLHTAFVLRHPFSKPAEPVYWRKADGSWVLLLSYTSTRPTVTGTMIPYLAGVMEVSPSGWISDHSVRDAARLFPGAPFFPPDLARQYGEAYAKWHGGLWSRAVSQASILEISEAVTSDPTANRFPFLQHFKQLGLQEVIPFEPQGQSSFPLVEVLLFDAGTGDTRLYRTPSTAVINAARKAIENVRKADPNADWSHRREVEPRLVVKPGGAIYWLISIVQNSPENPTNYAYIMSIIVNAKDLSAQRIDNAAHLQQFLSGQPVGH